MSIIPQDNLDKQVKAEYNTDVRFYNLANTVESMLDLGMSMTQILAAVSVGFRKWTEKRGGF